MRITVFGMWHLGCVSASCLAEAGNEVIGLDADSAVINNLRAGTPPLHEPGLNELIAAQSEAGRLSFTTDAREALSQAEILWVAFDTPVNDRDEADLDFVRRQLDSISAFVKSGTLVLMNSQVPVGFTRELEERWTGKGCRFACSPENLRLGKALDVFRNPDRVVLGIRHESDRALLTKLFAPFGGRIEWMSVESAEMTKHAINAFLATSVTFINELSRLCEAVGANAKEVERGLRSESRIGPRAYLSPGAAYAGGTLARDVRFLIEHGKRHSSPTPFFQGVLASNDTHKDWTRNHLRRILAGKKTSTIAVLGLTYKPGTSTLRRSSAVELCHWLREQGAKLQAHDPAIPQPVQEIQGLVDLCATAADALRGADAAVIATEWPDFRKVGPADIQQQMRHPCVIDPNHFLADSLGSNPEIQYVAVGRAAA